MDIVKVNLKVRKRDRDVVEGKKERKKERSKRRDWQKRKQNLFLKIIEEN